jgi:uncharacterized protein DUF3108
VIVRLASLVLGLALSSAEAQDAPRPAPFGVGERFEYDVKFGPLKVGRGSMEVAGIERIRGRDAWHIVFKVKGGTFFYKVDDTFESWVDTARFATLRFRKDQEEGGKNRDRHYEIYPERKVYVERTRDSTERESLGDPLDDTSFLYWVRTMDLEIGRTYELFRYFIPDRNPVRIKVLRRERISVPAGTYQTLVVQPLIKTTKIFSENAKAEIWLTEDSTRMMVQMKANLPFGNLSLHLRKARFAVDSTAQGNAGTPTAATPVRPREEP